MPRALQLFVLWYEWNGSTVREFVCFLHRLINSKSSLVYGCIGPTFEISGAHTFFFFWLESYFKKMIDRGAATRLAANIVLEKT